MGVQGNGTGSKSGFKMFFEQNKTLVFMLPILLIMIIVCVIIYIPKGEKPSDSVTAAADTAVTAESKVDVLPQTERVINEEAVKNAENSKDSKDEKAVKNPFEGPMTFTGVLVNSNGDNIAVIEGNGKSYVVRKGDMIGDSVQVDSITAEEVVLKENELTKSLKLEPKKNSTQTVNK